MLTPWVGRKLGGAEPQGFLMVGANSVSWVDGVSDMAPACQLYGSVEGWLRKGTMASAHLSVREKTVPQFLPWCQTLQFVPEFHWCLSSCYPDAGA